MVQAWGQTIQALHDVIVHYDTLFTLRLTASEMTDLEEYLKSL